MIHILVVQIMLRMLLLVLYIIDFNLMMLCFGIGNFHDITSVRNFHDVTSVVGIDKEKHLKNSTNIYICLLLIRFEGQVLTSKGVVSHAL